MSQRVGILGGSFDPIHIGHLAIAEAAREALRLERVIFVPAAQQPLKHGRHAAHSNQRFAMTQLACATNSAFEVSPIEIERPGPSYSVVTLEALRQTVSGDLFFILGADAAGDLGRWYAAERLIEIAKIVVMSRPGATPDRARMVDSIPSLADRMLLIEGPGLDISSTYLRERIAAGRSIRYLVPDAVIDYIIEHQLYQADEM